MHFPAPSPSIRGSVSLPSLPGRGFPFPALLLDVQWVFRVGVAPPHTSLITFEIEVDVERSTARLRVLDRPELREITFGTDQNLLPH